MTINMCCVNGSVVQNLVVLYLFVFHISMSPRAIQTFLNMDNSGNYGVHWLTITNPARSDV